MSIKIMHPTHPFLEQVRTAGDTLIIRYVIRSVLKGEDRGIVQGFTRMFIDYALLLKSVFTLCMMILMAVEFPSQKKRSHLVWSGRIIQMLCCVSKKRKKY